jgi:hypothetical protein
VKLVDISEKKKEYLKAQIDKLETNSKIKKITDLHRGISDFKKGCQPRTNTVKDEKRYLVTGCHGILSRLRNHFSQLLDVNHVRRRGIHKAEPLVLEPSASELELAVEKLKRHTRY